MPDLPPVKTVPAAWIAKQLGLELGELKALSPGWLPKLEADGSYEMQRAIEGGFAWLRHERDFIPNKEVAELAEISTGRISQLLKEGILSQDGVGRYERRKTIHALLRWYRQRVGEGKTTAGAAKNEALQLNNELLRQAVAKARGELIAVSRAKRVMANVILLACSKFRRLGNKIASRIPYLKDEAAIEAEVQREIDEALGELSRPLELLPEDDEPETGTATA